MAIDHYNIRPCRREQTMKLLTKSQLSENFIEINEYFSQIRHLKNRLFAGVDSSSESSIRRACDYIGCNKLETESLIDILEPIFD